MNKRALLLALLLLLTAAPRLLAHGGGELVLGLEPAGPYDVSVWVNPPQPAADAPVHFTVGVATQDEGAPVLDAEVLVEMRTADGETAAAAPATTAQSTNKLFYETDLELPQAGTYETIITVRGDAGAGSVAIDVDVQEPSGVNWLLIGLGGLAVVVVLGLWWSRQQQPLETAVAD